MSTVTPFWSRKVGSNNPLGIFTSGFAKSTCDAAKSYATTTLVQNPGRAFVHLCVMWGGAGFVINQWKKRKFHQERTFH